MVAVKFTVDKSTVLPNLCSLFDSTVVFEPDGERRKRQQMLACSVEKCGEVALRREKIHAGGKLDIVGGVL